MLPMLTGVVIMLAIGIFAQRSETVMSLFSDGPSASDSRQIVLTDDAVLVARGGFTRIDVLENDTGLAAEDTEQLVIQTPPVCGDAVVQDGAIQYRPGKSCGSFDSLTYRLADRSDRKTAVVRIEVGTLDQVMAAKEKSDTEAQPEQAPEIGAETVPEAVVVAETAPAPLPDQEPLAAPQPAPIREVAEAAPAGTIAEAESTAPGQAKSPSGLTAAMAVPDAPVRPLPKPGTNPVVVVTPEPLNEAAPGADSLEARPETPEPAAEWQTAAVAPEALRPVQQSQQGEGRLATPEPEPAEVDKVRPRLSTLSTTATNPGALQPGEEAGIRPAIVASITASDPATTRGSVSDLTADDTGFTAARASVAVITMAPARTAGRAPLEPASVNGGAPAHPGTLTDLPRIEIPEGGLAPLARPEKPIIPVAPAEEPVEIAALPEADAPCTAPPSMTLDIQAAARTGIDLVAPCHAGEVAELAYNDMRFALPLDQSGAGAITALGFEPTTAAVIRFADGEEMSFDLPFRGTDRVTRVALVWDMPVRLDLHALEFGAALAGAGDVSRDNPRSYEEIRPTGGGFMTSFLPVEGAGQPIEIYSHYIRRNGRAGVVELKIEYVSRDREALADTCGDGAYAKPRFKILRSEGGRIDRPFAGRLPSLACNESGAGDTSLAANSVGTLVITP
ncbi:hypothetical protein KHP62_02905 [Rhodobacteraceae bacterium NNCM2]|nr:hypothetical protein [Coraliihabitans acroporae]